MSISLKICALCQKELQRDTVEVSGTDITHYVCPTRTGEWKRLSHYWIEYKDRMYTQIINIPPYTITNTVGAHMPAKSIVMPLYFDENGIAHNNFDKMIVLPRVPLDRLDKLVERIKLLILFS